MILKKKKNVGGEEEQLKLHFHQKYPELLFRDTKSFIGSIVVSVSVVVKDP